MSMSSVKALTKVKELLVKLERMKHNHLGEMAAVVTELEPRMKQVQKGS